MANPELNLTGFTFAELFHSEGLYRLDLHFLNAIHPELRARLLAYREEIIAASTSRNQRAFNRMCDTAGKFSDSII